MSALAKRLENEFFFENILLQAQELKHIDPSLPGAFIALDEVGRGCLAGPVFVCASFWIPEKQTPSACFTKPRWLLSVNDSKKLSPQKRNACFELILKEHDFYPASFSPEKIFPDHPQDLSSSQRQVHFSASQLQKWSLQNSENIWEKIFFHCPVLSLGEASASEIDRFNIWNAVQLAAARALQRLREELLTRKKDFFSFLKRSFLLMDGKCFLKVPQEFSHFPQVTVTQADSLFTSVGFSSIIAKVCRDRFMESQNALFPDFRFHSHKGYGTSQHFLQIKKYGLCSLHRRSFLKKNTDPA